MYREIRLTNDDPTIWGKCMKCSRTGLGTHFGTYYARAFTKSEWAELPKCTNCGGELTKLYEVKK